jgi:hypothetical protein
MSAVTITDWEALGAFPARAAGPDDTNDAPCGTCEAMRADLAKAHALLKLLRRLEPKPVRSEGPEDSAADLAVISHSVYVATLRARIDLYLERTARLVRS